MDEINDCNRKYADAFAVLREKHGVTLQDVAQKSGIPLSTLKRTLQGTTGTPMSTYEMLVVKGLEATMAEFMDEIYGAQPEPQTAEQTPVQDVTAMRLLLAEKDRRIAHITRWLNRAVTYSIIATVFIVLALIIDILIPNAGWIQRQIEALHGGMLGWLM